MFHGSVRFAILASKRPELSSTSPALPHALGVFQWRNEAVANFSSDALKLHRRERDARLGISDKVFVLASDAMQMVVFELVSWRICGCPFTCFSKNRMMGLWE